MFNMKFLLMMAVLALLVLPMASFGLPQDIATACGENNTLTFSIASVRCINGVCNLIQNNSTILCQYGCNNKAVPNECNPAPSQVNIVFYFGAIVFMLIVLGVYKYLKSR